MQTDKIFMMSGTETANLRLIKYGHTSPLKCFHQGQVGPTEDRSLTCLCKQVQDCHLPLSHDHRKLQGHLLSLVWNTVQLTWATHLVYEMSENNLEIKKQTVAETFVSTQHCHAMSQGKKNKTHFLPPVPSGKQHNFVKGPVFWKKQCTQGKSCS